jgi:bla regulator protein BlaR1
MTAGLTNHLWQSTLLAALAGLLAILLRKNHARARHWIWLSASCKFLIPFSLLIAIGSHFGFRSASEGSSTRFSYVMEEISQPFTRADLRVSPAAAPAAGSIAPTLFLVVWLCGCCSVLWSWWVRCRRLHAALRTGIPLHLDGPISIPVVSTPALLEPGVFGIFRPVLLLPEGITERLTEPQLQAILAHELCHVRRRDNLASAVHMVVEAIFWFHPLVWWLGARLVEEREQACDEEVLRLGNEPQVYAEGILKVCEFYLRSPLVCVSGVTGANLKRRIEGIMTHRVARQLDFGRKMLLTAIGIAAVAGPLAIGIVNAPRLRAQSQAEAAAAFDVASIKPSKPGTRGFSINPLPGGRFTTSNTTLKMLISTAYRIYDFQVSGGPNWLDSYRVDIQAKADAGAKPEQLRAMLQKLLADRFGLGVHRETRELPTYALVVAKSGPKIQQSKDAEGTPEFRVFMRSRITAKRASLSLLTEALAMLLSRPVSDKTGLQGGFEYKLEWTPDQSQTRGNDDPLPPDPDRPSIFVALQEQLGLKLESQKGPVEIIVIDRAEKPSEN